MSSCFGSTQDEFNEPKEHHEPSLDLTIKGKKFKNYVMDSKYTVKDPKAQTEAMKPEYIQNDQNKCNDIMEEMRFQRRLEEYLRFENYQKDVEKFIAKI